MTFEIIIKKYKKLLFLIPLSFFLVYLSHKTILTYYFWRDDWNLFYDSIIRPDVYLRPSLKVLLDKGIVVAFFGFIQINYKNYYLLQFLGLMLKVVNTVLVYFFIQKVTKNNYAALAGFLFYSVYSGGLEAYSWVRNNALALTLLLLVFIVIQNYSKSISVKKYLISGILGYLILYFVLGKGNFARIAGTILPFLFFLFSVDYSSSKVNILNYFRNKEILFLLSFILLFTGFYISAKLTKVDIFSIPTSLLHDSRGYFGSVGSLVRNPFLYKKELVALTGADILSTKLGLISLLTLIITFIEYLKTKIKFYSLITFSLLWIHSAYIVNWFFGGGSTKTVVASSHRYMAVPAIGLVLFISLILNKIPRKISLLILLILLLVSYRYTKRITEADYWLRGEPIVGSVYSTVANEVPEDVNARVLLVDTVDELKGPVVNWSLPWAYAYYKRLDYKDFPVIFARTDDASNWICAENERRNIISKSLGVDDRREGRSLNIDEIFAWRLSENGDLENRTEKFRSLIKPCISN